MALDDRLAALLAALRVDGGRLTAARRAVAEALVDADHHVTADELIALVQASNPRVNRSTVYRTLEALERQGAVEHVHLGHGRAEFHLAGGHHQHLACEVCGRVSEVPDDVFAPLVATLTAEYAFVLQPDHFALLGRCSRCARLGHQPPADQRA